MVLPLMKEQDSHIQNMDNPSNIFSWIRRHPLSNFEHIISEKYPSRKISDKDPSPIFIDCNKTGPIRVSGGFVICDGCGGIIRENYLMKHRESGACDRRISKRNVDNSKYFREVNK